MRNSIDHKRRDEQHKRFIFLLLFSSYAITGISTYRLQSVLSSAMVILSADEAQLGVLISVTSFVALLTTVLMGVIVMRIGYFSSLTMAMVLELTGLLVALKFLTYQGLLVSQLFLGFGNALIMVTAPSLMQSIFSPHEFSLRIGVINAGQTAGQGLVFLLFPMLIAQHGFSSIWSTLLIPTGVLLLIWGLLWRNEKRKFFDEPRIATRDAEVKAEIHPSFPLKDSRFWILSAGVLFSMLSAGAALNYTALYLNSIKGLSESVAGKMMFGCTITGVLAAMTGGAMGRQFGPRRVYILISILQTTLRLLIVLFNDRFALATVTALTGVPAAMVVICNAAVPRLCQNSRYVPIAVSMVATATTGGLALSSLGFGKLIKTIGFDASFFVCVPCSLLALLAALVIPEN